MSLSAYIPKTWVDYADTPCLEALELNRIDTGIGSVTAELLALEAALPTTYQPISSELSALAGLSSTGYAKRTGAGAWSVVASIPQADVSGLTAALAGKEPTLGSPSTSGYLLSSTSVGVRSWVAPYVHPATHPQSVVDSASGWITTALAGKQGTITTGTTAQYLRGDLSLATFPTTWAGTALTGLVPDANISSAATWNAKQAGSSVLTSIAAQSSGTGFLRLAAGVASLDATAYQPLDSDLTAIAALTTTTFGRSLLTVADAAAARTAIGAQAAGSYQPLDPDLTAVAALATTGFVRRTAADAWAASVLVWGDIASGHPSVTAGTGLTGGGSLTGSVTLAVSYGTAAGTAAQGNDSRILNGQTAFGWGNHASAGYAFATHSHGDLTFRDGAVWRNWTGNAANGVNYKMLYAGGVTPGDGNYSFGFANDGSWAWMNASGTIDINNGGTTKLRIGANSVTLFAALTGTAATFSGAVTGSNLAIANWNSAYTHSQIASGNPHGTTFASLVSKPTTLAGYGITDAATTTLTNDFAWGNVINDNTDMNTPEAGGTGRSSVGTWTSGTNSPFGNIWYNVVNVRHRNGGGDGASGYGGQLVWGMTGAQNRIGFRSRNSGATWQPWYELWHSGNLTGTRNEHNHAGVYLPVSGGAMSGNIDLGGYSITSGSTGLGNGMVSSVGGNFTNLKVGTLLKMDGLTKINVGDNFVPSSDLGASLGEVTKRWLYLYALEASLTTLDASSSIGAPTVRFKSPAVIFSGSTLPAAINPGDVVAVVGDGNGATTNKPVTNALQAVVYRKADGTFATAAAGGNQIDLDLYGKAGFVLGISLNRAQLIV